MYSLGIVMYSLCIVMYSLRIAMYSLCIAMYSLRIAMYSPCIVMYRYVLLCITLVLSCNGVYFEVSYRIVVYRRVVGYQERSVVTVLTSIVHVSSGRQERSHIGTYRACIEKVKSGVLRTGTYSRYSHVSNGSNFACAEHTCIVMYRACLERVQIWGSP